MGRFARLFAFRFGVVLAGLWLVPFVIDLLPHGDPLALAWDGAWQWLLDVIGHRILGIAGFDPAPQGDSAASYLQAALMIGLGGFGAAIWSAIDRRTAYPRLAIAVRTALRYSLAYTMLTYGALKFMSGQFPALRPGELDVPLGELSPMGLMWAFMSYSKVYGAFAGMLEVSAGLLLLWRGTATLGALAAAAVMSNVLMMDICFDVPIKLYAGELLVLAIVLAAPGLRRILAASLGHGVAPLDAAPRGPRWFERLRIAMPWLALANLAWAFVPQVEFSLERDSHVHPLYGAWSVDDFTLDGAPRPPLMTDAARWRKLLFNGHGLWIVSMPGERTPARLVVDTVAHTLTLTPGDGYSTARADGSKQAGPEETWRYAQDGERLTVDAERAGHHLHATLHRDPPPLLLTRQLRWLNPRPFRARDAVP